jgi:hypothetical protein
MAGAGALADLPSRLIRIAALAVWLAPLAATAAEPAPPAPWQADEQRLYAALAADQAAGRPLVVTTFVNLTYYGSCPPPDRNVHWGSGYGYSSFFSITQNAPFFHSRFPGWRFRQVHAQQRTDDPEQVAIFRAEVLLRGRAAGSRDGRRVPLYLVNLAWRDGEAGLRALREALLQGRGSFVFTTRAGVRLDAVADARLIGWAGHNSLFDLPADELPELPATSERVVGTYALGCCTAPVGRCAAVALLPHLRGPGVVPLVFTSSLMTGEAYSFLGMVDALVRGLPLPALVQRANDEYQAFQRHHGHRTGRPFVEMRRLHGGPP